MKFITITNEEIKERIIEHFKNYFDLENSCSIIKSIFKVSRTEELEKLFLALSKGEEFKIDCFQDIEIFIDGVRFWMISEPKITSFNKAGKYEISLKYEIHKNSKYSPSIYTFTI